MKANGKRHVLAIGLEYPLALRGGVSVLVEALIEGLSREWQIVLISPEETASLEKHPLRGRLLDHIPFYQTAKPPKSAFANERDALIQRLRELGVEILHLHCGGVYGWGNRWPGSSVPRAAKNAGLRVFWTNHLVVSLLDGYCGKNKPLWFKLAMLPLGWLGKLDQMAAVECEIAVSDHDRRKLARWYFPLRHRLLRIYHSRLGDISSFETSERSSIILSVGHIAFRKGQHILAEAFAQIAKETPGWQLWIAGHDGGDGCWQQIEAIQNSSGLNDRLRLLGARSDTTELMRKASVFVQPSLEEALGLALQEALFEECACIGTDAGGIPELLSGPNTGLLIKKNSPSELAAALKHVIENPEKRRLLSSRGRAHILELKMLASDMLDEHLVIYSA